MKVLWTLLKAAVALAILVPVALIVLGAAMLALRLALLGLVAYGAFKLLARLLRAPKPSPVPTDVPQLRSADPYYRAAMRELDRDIGDPARG